MNISSSSNAYASSQAQSLLSLLMRAGQGLAGQDSPGGTNGVQDSAPPPPPPPGPPPGGGVRSLANRTLSSLLGAQEQRPSSSDLASQVINAADTDGDGTLRLTEIQSALGAQSSDSLSSAFSAIDTNSDGKLSAQELTTGLEAARTRHAHHGRHTSSDIAASLINSTDTDADGALSLAEITAKLGVPAASSDASVTSRFATLDKDGDGKLSATEIASAIDALANYGRAAASADTATAVAGQTDATASVSTTA